MPRERSVETDGYALKGPGGVSLRAISWGATVTHLYVPDRAGRCEDIVLGFDDDGEYRKAHPYFGVMAGRVAGRISGAAFTLHGQRYALAANDGPHHLHGGAEGFDKREWEARPEGKETVVFSRVSADGEEGYPGRVETRVTYMAGADSMTVMAEGKSDGETPFSMTHHSYFNLAGVASGETIEGHELRIFADSYAPTDERMGLLGKRVPVEAGNDFWKPRVMGEAIPKLFKRHGDLYFVNRGPEDEGKLVEAARVVHRRSGRVMKVLTTEPCIQLYTGMGLDGTLKGKGGRPIPPFAGMCLECEGYPDGAKVPELGNIVLKPGEKRVQVTVYQFSTV